MVFGVLDKVPSLTEGVTSGYVILDIKVEVQQIKTSHTDFV